MGGRKLETIHFPLNQGQIAKDAKWIRMSKCKVNVDTSSWGKTSKGGH